MSLHEEILSYGFNETILEDQSMPVFEFFCKACEHITETGIIKRSERPDILTCSKCGADMVPAMSSKVGSKFPQGRCKGGYERPSYNNPI